MIGTYKGVCRYDPISGRTDSIYASPQELVILDSKNYPFVGMLMTIILRGAGQIMVCVFNKNGVVIKTFKNNEQDTTSLTNNRITVVFADENKNIWVGTQQDQIDSTGKKITFIISPSKMNQFSRQ